MSRERLKIHEEHVKSMNPPFALADQCEQASPTRAFCQRQEENSGMQTCKVDLMSQIFQKRVSDGKSWPDELRFEKANKKRPEYTCLSRLVFLILGF